MTWTHTRSVSDRLSWILGNPYLQPYYRGLWQDKLPQADALVTPLTQEKMNWWILSKILHSPQWHHLFKTHTETHVPQLMAFIITSNVCTFIIFDDGSRNPTHRYDCSFAVVTWDCFTSTLDTIIIRVTHMHVKYTVNDCNTNTSGWQCFTFSKKRRWCAYCCTSTCSNALMTSR